MADYMDFFNRYIMGIVQMLTGFYFFARLLQKKVRIHFYLLFAVWGGASIYFVSAGRIAEFGAFVLLLFISGIFICRTDWKSAVLYAVLTVEVMHLCYGIVNSLLSISYSFLISFDPGISELAFLLLGNTALLLSAFCYSAICRNFSGYEAEKKKYVLMILIPLLLLFFMGEYISCLIYDSNISDFKGMKGSGSAAGVNYYRMLMIQLLGMASLFCILFSYKKLLQNFRLGTELSLLEQEERSLNMYVEEAKVQYEKTKSFRHDIKNHITVVKELLQNGKEEQALNYLGDMGDMAKGLSFPCSTNNPVADILIGNKLGMAKEMGIDVCCSLLLPYPCGLRDIDVCIILSNALDNGICACKNIEDDREKFIRITGRIQGDFILMEIENSFQGSGFFKRGTGLSNIKAVAEKYHGAVSTKTRGGVFILSVLLIIPQHQESILRQIG